MNVGTNKNQATFQCPSCKYKMPAEYPFTCGGAGFIFCPRCGCSENAYVFREPRLNAAVQIRRTDGGEGAYVVQEKGMHYYTLGSVDNRHMCNDCFETAEFSVHRTTFCDKGRWFIRDELTDEVTPFSYEALFGPSPRPGTSQPGESEHAVSAVNDRRPAESP